METPKCLYCFSNYSTKNFPNNLSCKCMVCGNCAGIIVKNKILVCPSCNKHLDLSQINQHNTFYNLMTTNSASSFIEEEKKTLDLKLDEKIELCKKIISEKKKGLHALKSIKPLFDTLIKAQLLKNYNLSGNIDEKIEFIKKHELLKLQITEEAKELATNHIHSFNKSILYQILQNEKIEVCGEEQLYWTGNELVNRNIEEHSETLFSSDTNCIILNSIGIIMRGNTIEGSCLLKIEIFVSNQRVFNQTLNENEINQGRHIKELNLGRIMMPLGNYLKVVLTGTKGEGIVMKLSGEIQIKDTTLKFQGDYSKLAYLGLAYNNQ